MTNGIPHPFEIFWDVDSASYYIFVPDGCVLVNGVAATNDEVDNGNLALDFGDTPPEKVYCHVSKEEDEESGESSWKFTIDGEAEEDGAKYNVLVATFGQSENDGQSYDVVCSAISLGGGEIVGDYDGSETISGDEEPILITGHPGEEDAQGHDSHSGLQFLTVGARTDEETGEKISPKIVARIIDKAEDEDWAARSLTVTPAEGSPKTVHFLGSEDIDIEIPSAPEPPDPLEGSDYIDVDTAVSAKVATPANQQAANAPNALLTHNTDQFVRSKKTFLGLGSDDNALKKVVIDGPNGKIEVKDASGDRIIKLDATDIPNECGQGGAVTIQVRKLTVTHPRAKDGKTADIYHVIGCADIDIHEGDAIQSITSGAPTQSGGFTVTPVTITLKDGTSLPAFNVSAKNGADGDDGDDGDDAGLKVSATTHQPTQSDTRTGVDVTLTPTINGVDQTPTNFTIYDGKQGVGIGSVSQKSASGKTKTYSVMSDEATPKELGTFTVTDGEDGQDGDDGNPAGFDTPTAAATELEPGSAPTVTVTASGPDTAKVFAFQFGIPKGKGEQSDWGETDSSADSFIKNKPTIPAEQVNADWNATSGKAQILNKPTLADVATSGDYEDLTNKPTIPTIPDITATPSGTGNVVTGVTANGHALTVTKGTVKGNVQSDWNATSGDAHILNKPTSLKNPYSLTIKKNGSSDVVYDGSAAKTITLDPGGVTKIIGSGAVHVSPASGTGEVTVSSTVRNLKAGSGISLDDETIPGTIIITNTAQGGGGTTEGISKTVSFIDGFKYDVSSHKLMYHFGTIKFENGLAVEHTAGTSFVDIEAGAQAVEETV